MIGRFTQEDEYRGDGLNLYSYVGNNPVNYIDPSGYKKQCELKAELIERQQKRKNGELNESNLRDKTLVDPSERNIKREQYYQQKHDERYERYQNTDGSSNPYNWTNKKLQDSMNKITLAAYEELLKKSSNGRLFNGGPRQTLTVTQDGKVILSQNSSAVNKVSVSKAYEIFDNSIEIVGGGKGSTLPGMSKNYGNHAETKGINALEKQNIDTKGVKQVSSHYSCSSCEGVQRAKDIINVTGNASDYNNIQKRPLLKN